MDEEIIVGKEAKWIVTKVVPREDYSLILTFITGEVKLFDAKDLVKEEMYARLRDVSFFMSAKVECGSIAWDEDLDIAPEFLYENSSPYEEAK